MDNENKKASTRSARAKAKMTPEQEQQLAESEIKKVQAQFAPTGPTGPTEPKSNGPETAPDKGPEVRFPVHPLNHIQSVMQAAGEKGFAGATDASKKADKKTIKEAAMLTIPPDWRGTFPALAEKLSDEDLSLLLAYFAHLWHQGYQAGQFDAGRGFNVQKQNLPQS